MRDISTWQEAVRRLADSDLNLLEVLDAELALRLRFTFAGFAGGEGHDVLLCLHGVERLELARRPGSEAVYYVIQATLESVDEAGTEKLRFRLEGELELNVVCQNIQVFDEVGAKDMSPAAAAAG